MATHSAAGGHSYTSTCEIYKVSSKSKAIVFGRLFDVTTLLGNKS